MDFSSSLGYAIELNNESVSLLYAGQDEQAVTKLSKALSMVRQQISVNPSKGSWQPMPDPTACKGARVAMPSRVPLAQLRDANYFLYNQCITIPTTLQRNPKDIPLFCACIVLNLALTYHRLAQRGYYSCMEKAEKMYTMAIRLLGGPQFSSNVTALSIRLIAFNNLAQVHQELRRFDETRADIQEMSSMLNEAMSNGAFFTNCDLRSFVLNVMLYGPPKAAAAA
eukprot:Nitzschia sp. Nitz4//scaffold159_size51929//40936//41610//NITZ4_006885-RA/size51929-processed-gene-0.55-mRNA-1//-1//CDS//3329537592//6958//frame0